MICCRIFVTFNILIGLHCMGVNVELVVIDGVLKDGSFECNNPVTFRCLVNPNTTIVQWFVGNPIGQFPDADCTGSPCGTSYEFPGRYEYTYNKSAGISYLKIAYTSFKDNQLIYQCSNGSSLHRGTYNATVIKAPPKNDTATLDIKTTTDQVKATVKMGCIYPVEDVVLKWYSTRAQETREHHGNYQLVPCSPVSNCERANTTKEGVLVINTTQTGEEREYFVNISFGSMYFLKPVGKYNVTLVIECNPGKGEPIACWIFGIIVVIIAIAFGVFITIVIVRYERKETNKDLYPCYLKGAISEVAVIIFEIVFIILVVRFVQGSKDDCIDSFPCWAILLIVLVVFIILLAICVVIIILDPVHSVAVLSRTIQGETMTVKIQWSSRLFHFKKFYADFESEINESFIKELKYKSCYDGSLECVISGLSLDNDYQAQVYSKICNIRSLGKTIVFDTKGRALPPDSFAEEEQQRTESSVTLTWIAAKGHTDHYYIKYKRQKERRDVWEVTPVIKNTYYTVDKLKSGTKYTFKIFAVNSIGHSDESSCLTVRTNAIEVLPPTNFEPIEVNANTLKLSWKPSNKLKKQGFILNCLNMADKTTGSEIDGHEIPIPYDGKTPMIYTVNDLKPGAKYSLKILTCVGKRKSEYSNVVEIQTKGCNT